MSLIVAALAVIGAIWVLFFTWLAGRVIRNGLADFRQARRHRPPHDRLPLPLLRLVTWRKRRRSNRCNVLADHLQAPLSPREELAWARLHKEIR